jgi:peptide/nickel transport system substrate-binding protein
VRRLTILLLVISLVGAGCTAGEDPETPSGDAERTAEPVRGGTLVVALTSDPGGLNPAITTSGVTHYASELMFNGLVGLGPRQEPLPELATRWDVEGDGQLYRFHLREGVTWHDGRPFTSADVKFSFDEVLLKFHSRTRASISPVLESIQTPDEQTVEFRFKQPYAPLLLQLDVTEAPIVPKHLYEGSDPLRDPANAAPIGTGPFKFVSYAPGAEIVLERNPDYFKEGVPYLDRVVQRVIPEEGNRVLALEAGEVDWIWEVPGPDQDRLRESGDFELVRTDRNPGGSNCIMTVSFNLERPIFADIDTRRAFASALDRDQFLERVLFGEGRVAEAPISSGIAWAHADDLPMPDFDREEAERLLDQAGWERQGDGVRTARGVQGVPDGTPLRFDFLHFPNFTPYGELLRAQLGSVGAEVTLRPMESPVFVQAVFTERNFDTNIISYCNGNDPEIGVRRMFDSANIGPVPFSNAAAYRNSEVDRLFAEAASTLSRDERGDLYRQIQEEVVRDLPYWWVVETSATRGHTTRCTGFIPYAHFAESVFCDR